MDRAFIQRGQVLVEFILIAPVLLAIAGGALEIARFLRYNQTASIVSQEAALSTYRRCSDFFLFNADGTFNYTGTAQKTEACLNRLREDIQAQVNRLYDPTTRGNPEFLLVLSVYRRDSVLDARGTAIGFVNLERIMSASAPNDAPSSPLASLYQTSANTIQRIGSPSIQVVNAAEAEQMERIVIAEVAYRYTPVIPIYKVLLGDGDFLRTDERFRETTIL
jgi:hypothetical protein